MNVTRIPRDDSQFFEDIKELCVLCAKGVVTIAERHHYNPKDVSKLFIELYTKIQNDVENTSKR